MRSSWSDADAAAARIYAAAYTQQKDAPEFYQFVTLLELYPKLIGNSSAIAVPKLLVTRSNRFCLCV